MKYQGPKIQTLKADRIVEMMGPVSCGSGRIEFDPQPKLGGISGQTRSGGGFDVNR